MPSDWIQPALNALCFIIIPVSEFVSKLDNIPDLSLPVQMPAGISLLLFLAFALRFPYYTVDTG